MRYRFDGFEVDTQNREVERDGSVRPLQPQAFALLAFLIRHRDRVVSKAELLAELWPDAVVGEGSIQRAVHLARVAIDDDGTRIRTVPKLGYRFIATVEEVHDREPKRTPAFSPRFVQCNDGVHIAYHTFGEGSLDIVLVPGWVFPMRASGLPHASRHGCGAEKSGVSHDRHPAVHLAVGVPPGAAADRGRMRRMTLGSVACSDAGEPPCSSA